MESKKRKKLSITEGTGGSHAGSLVESGAVASDSEKDIEVETYQTTTIISENIQCPVCKGNFSSMSAYNSHSCS